MSTATTANELAVLFGGRKPEWSQQANIFQIPINPSAGVDTGNSVVTMLAVALRRVAHYRSARVTITTFDGTANWTVTINGTGITATNPYADVDAALKGLFDAIAADATVGGAAGANQVVSSQLLDSNGAVTLGSAAAGNPAVTLEVFGSNVDITLADIDYSIDKSASATGVLAVDADALTADMRVYFSARGSGQNLPIPGPEWWSVQPTYSIETRGFIERLDVGGLQKGAAALSNLVGHATDGVTVTYTDSATVWWGPAALEGG